MSDPCIETGVRLEQPRRYHRLVKLVLVVSAFFIAVAGYGLWWLSQWANSPIDELESQQFSIIKGDNVTRIGRRLNKAGQFETIWPLRLLVLNEPKLAQLRVGTYQLDSALSPRQLLQHLSSGKELQFSLTFVEGTTFKQWRQQLAAEKHIVFTPQQLTSFKQLDIFDQQHAIAGYDDSWIEGQLYPDTYSFTAGTNASDILSRAAIKLKNELNQAWRQRDQGLPFRSVYQALILASIIEKETATNSERRTIASVFINRLNKKMRLQTDPTVIYGIGDKYAGDIKRVHLRDKNPYNTYVIKGLPPTPIAMPGRASIEAALHPEKTDYLYFVAQADGSHYFSTTLKEHNSAVRRYLLSQTDK